MNTSNPDAFRRAKRLGPAALLALLLVVAWDPAAPGSSGGIADAAPPSPPATITVHRGSNFLDVVWSAVDGATGYDVAYSANDGWSWTRAATGVTGTTYRITGVPNAGGHIVGMRVTTAGGTSDWKNSATNYAALEPYPAGDVEVTRAAGELLVSWTQCDVSLAWCNGGSPVTGYVINLSSDGGASWTRAKTLASYTSGSTVTLDSGIVDATAYVVSVGIENRVGTNWTGVSVEPLVPTDPTPSKDISVARHPTGVWSDGTTLYVSWFVWSLQDGGVLAYDLATGTRDTSKEITLHADNNWPFGIWGDADTLWIQDRQEDRIYAYNRTTKARDTSKEIVLDTAGGNADGWGIGSDGETLWVKENGDGHLYAYKLTGGSGVFGTRDSAKDFNTLVAAGNGQAEGLWSDGTTLWASDYSDGKIYAYKVSDKSRDATKDYELVADNAQPTGIWSNGTTMYVADNNDDKIYAYRAYPPKPADPDVLKNISVDRHPTGVWSDGTTLYVSWFVWSLQDGGVLAYDLATGTRDTSKEITLHADNNWPFGIWGDATTLWIQDRQEDLIYAYNRATKARDTSKEITLDTAGGNADGWGIGSDGTTLWVKENSDNKLYAYKLTGGSGVFGTRDSAKDFDTLVAAGNAQVEGLWSDGTTLWASDYQDGKVYAYKVADKSRDATKDYELVADNANPTGIWSNGTTMYVADNNDDKIYAYHAYPPPPPPSNPPATLNVYRGPIFLDVAWSTVGGATGYDIAYSADDGYNWTRAATGATGTSYRITGIPNTGAHIVSIRATNMGGASGWRNSATIYSAIDPHPAEAIQVTRAAGELRVSWTQCDVSQDWCNGGSPVTGYFINLSSNGGASWTRAKTLTAYTSGTTVTLDSGIDDGTAYLVAVGIESRMGTQWTNVSVGSALPGTPSSVTVHRGSNFLDVEWPAASGATGYNVNYTSDAGASWSRAATGVSGTSYRIDNVPNTGQHKVAVQATNAIGASGWRNSTTNYNAVDPHPAEAIQVTRAAGELRVSWTQCDVSQASCNGGSAVTGYFINLSSDGGASWTRVKTLTAYTSGATVTVDSGIDDTASYLLAVGIENRVATRWTNVQVGPYTP